MTTASLPNATSGPNLFLVGAPKCGTTSLYEYLRVHPQIFFPYAEHAAETSDAEYWGGKEPAYFCTDLDLSLDHPVRDTNAYLRLYAGSESRRWRGDASAFYLYSEIAAKRIRSFCPDARIIILLRPPIAQMRSLHTHLVRVSQECEADFHAAVQMGDTGRFRHDLLTRRAAGVADYFGVAQYADQVERYFRAFGKPRVRVLLLEELATRPADTYRSVLEFLGVDPSFAPVFRVHNGRPPDAGLETLLYRVHAVPGVRQLADRVFPYRVRRRLVDWVRRRRATRVDPRDEALRERCRPGIQRLAALIDRDLSHWL